jgi:hypothetical protein
MDLFFDCFDVCVCGCIHIFVRASSSTILVYFLCSHFELHSMCEVCQGNLQEQQNGGSARLWVIKGQGRWLRSNKVDLHGFLGIQFERLMVFDMPMERMTAGGKKKFAVWRSESLRCVVGLQTCLSVFDKGDIYIEGLKGWRQEHSNIKKFVNAYVRALCFKTCHIKVNSHTQEGNESRCANENSSCSHGDAEKRIDPADEKPYTYEELAAWYAGKYSIDVIRTYWLYECHCISHVSTQRTLCALSLTDRLQDGAKERRPDDVALWNQLKFQDGRLVRFPKGISWGLIHALQQPRDSKYFGDDASNMCKVIKDGWVPTHNKRMFELLTENDKAEKAMLRMSSNVVKEANRFRMVKYDLLESILAMYVSSLEDGRETDFRCTPYHLDWISMKFRDVCEFVIIREDPRASKDFMDLCHCHSRGFPPYPGDNWPYAWPMGKKACEDRFPHDFLTDGCISMQ